MAERPLDAIGLLHAREGYRTPLSGTAVVLPILDCNTQALAVLPNPDARSLVEKVFPSEIWSRLGLPGTAEDGRVDASDTLCDELADNVGKGTNLILVSPAMREELRNLFTFHPGRSWVVAITHTLKIEEQRETRAVLLSAYVFAPNGEVAFRADLACDPENKTPKESCGSRYEGAPERIAELLDGFPKSILTDAKIVSALPPEVESPATPAGTAPKKKRGGKHRR